MNLGDPEWELVDPTPNIYALFVNFDKTFFWSKLESRAAVRWSKRMYSCAGTCSYGGRSGFCDIALSEPLLKLRPRKDLIETLLHEMIHAYLFVTCQDQDRDGHGPNFKSHMHRINKSAGLNISIYHDFHDEVELYQTHWWRCNGPCQRSKPRFGIVRRSVNRAPGPTDYWWSRHQKTCGGTFIKIKEPENYGKKGAAKTNKATSDITKFITNTGNKDTRPVLKTSNSITTLTSVKTKSNNMSTFIVPKKDVLFNPQVVKPGTSYNGEASDVSNRKRSASVGVVEHVRNVWANKQIPLTPLAKGKSIIQGTANKPKNKQSIETEHPEAPKSKIMKIDDFFKKNATSVLKDIYGQDFELKSSNDGKKLIAEVKTTTTTNVVDNVTNQNTSTRNTEKRLVKLVDCPVCLAKIDSEIINRHLDECLNKEVIKELNSVPYSSPGDNPIISNGKPKQNDWEDVPKFNTNNSNIKLELPDSLDLSFVDELLDKNQNKVQSKPDALGIRNIYDKASKSVDIKIEEDDYISKKVEDANKQLNIKIKDENPKVTCPCCGKQIKISLDQHLEECLIFFDNNNTMPIEGGGNIIDTIVLDDDDDRFDDSLTLNATGTKLPCPCCLQMIEEADMNTHLDGCLS